jgi:Fur family ferric uptake transcriptional regulator
MAASPDVSKRAHRQLADHLGKHGLKQTRQRDAILDAFLASEGHMTSEELYERVRQEHPEVGAATIYRTLKLFCDAGIARAHAFRDGVTLYERAGEHHDHLICTQCGEIIEFESDVIAREQERIAERYGFALARRRHILYGICTRPSCPRRPVVSDS